MNSICPSSASFDQNLPDPAAFVLRGLQASKAVGSTVMRCYLGDSRDRRRENPDA